MTLIVGKSHCLLHSSNHLPSPLCQMQIIDYWSRKRHQRSEFWVQCFTVLSSSIYLVFTFILSNGAKMWFAGLEVRWSPNLWFLCPHLAQFFIAITKCLQPTLTKKRGWFIQLTFGGLRARTGFSSAGGGLYRGQWRGRGCRAGSCSFISTLLRTNQVP